MLFEELSPILSKTEKEKKAWLKTTLSNNQPIVLGDWIIVVKYLASWSLSATLNQPKNSEFNQALKKLIALMREVIQTKCNLSDQEYVDLLFK